MNRKPVIRHLPDFEGRTIVISDLHGNDTLFLRLLEKCQYIPGKDRLILLGDLVEKGSENLSILHHIMDLCDFPEVYAIMGNCDFVAKNILYSYRLEFLRGVLLNRKSSLLHEMADSLGLPKLDQKTDMNEYAAALRKGFLKELAFLNDLPHVLITPSMIFAHSGIEDEETIADDFRYVMTRFRFDEEDHHFTRLVVVGHMPVSEYCSRYADFNPRFNREKNILSIDGGNMVKKAGQLNAVIFHKDYMETISEDLLEPVKAVRSTHPNNFAPLYLTWNQGDVHVLETREKQSYVRSDALHRRFWIDNDFLQDSKGSNYTSYELPLREGETVHLVNVWSHKAQVKKNGILGWTDLANLDLSEEQKEEPLDLR